MTLALKISEMLKVIFQTGLKQRQNGGVAISPTVQQNDELAGSFKNSVNRSVEAEFYSNTSTHLTNILGLTCVSACKI